MVLLNRDIDAYRSKAGIEAAVVETLRKYGLLLPKPKRRPQLTLVPKNENDD